MCWFGAGPTGGTSVLRAHLSDAFEAALLGLLPSSHPDEIKQE